MKTWLRKFSAYSLVAAVLLIIACTVPMSGEKQDLDKPPEGMGYARLIFSGPERTIMPAVPNDISPFNSYRLEFTAAGGGGVSKNEDINSLADLGKPILLAMGNYNLKVTAYLETMQVDPAAEFLTAVTISDVPGGTSIPIILKWITPQAGQQTGTFTWNIDLDDVDDLAAGTMTVKDGGGSPVVAIDGLDLLVSANCTSSAALNPGYFNVEINLARSDGSTLIWQQALHVYQALTSHLELEFLKDQFSTTPVMVEFVLNYPGDLLTRHAVRYAMPSACLAAFPAAPLDRTETIPNYIFDAWYEEPGGVTVFDLSTPIAATDPTNMKMIVYARWNLNVVIEEIQDGSPIVPDEVVLSYSGAGSVPKSFTVTITNAGLYQSFEWSYGDYPDPEPLSTGNSLTVDISESNMDNWGPFVEAQTYLINVHAVGIDNNPYSAYFTIKIIP